MRRLLAPLLLISPLLAAAQSSGGVVFSPNNVIARAGCVASSTQKVSIGWSATLDGTPTVTTGGEFRIYATNTAPTANYCALTNNGTIFAALVATVQNGTGVSATVITSQSVATHDIAAAAGETACRSGSPTVYVCVHWHPNSSSTAQAYAKGTMVLELDGPPAPTVTSVSPDTKALIVAISSGASTLATKFRAKAVAEDTVAYPGEHLSDETALGSDARIEGLINYVPYFVTAFSYAANGNASDESCPYLATGAQPTCTGGVAVAPLPVADDWDYYKDVAGGRDDGGCDAGPAGILALLGAAALLRLRRRS